MDGGIETEVYELRRRAIDMNLSFAEMAPLLRRVRLLSLNAEITSDQLGERGASFSVVVKEVSSMAAELKELVDETEAASWDVVNLVAFWMRDEKIMDLVQHAINYTRSEQVSEDGENGEPCASLVWKQALLENVDREWEKEKSLLDPEGTEFRMWESVLEKRKRMLGHLLLLNDMSVRLYAMVERINLVAARKSNFLAVSAMIESARVSEGGSDLTTVAENIRTLANDIAAVESRAIDQAGSLRALSARLTEFVTHSDGS